MERRVIHAFLVRTPLTIVSIVIIFCLIAGCACRFLYGPETKDEHKGQIEKSLDGKLELKLEVIFYKKNGKLAVKSYTFSLVSYSSTNIFSQYFKSRVFSKELLLKVQLAETGKLF